MRRKDKLWTTISSTDHDKLLMFKKEHNLSAISKAVLFVLKKHDEIEEDYFYNSMDAKTIMVTVDSKTKEEIEQLAKGCAMTESKYIRCKLHSFLNK